MNFVMHKVPDPTHLTENGGEFRYDYETINVQGSLSEKEKAFLYKSHDWDLVAHVYHRTF